MSMTSELPAVNLSADYEVNEPDQDLMDPICVAKGLTFWTRGLVSRAALVTTVDTKAIGHPLLHQAYGSDLDLIIHYPMLTAVSSTSVLGIPHITEPVPARFVIGPKFPFLALSYWGPEHQETLSITSPQVFAHAEVLSYFDGLLMDELEDGMTLLLGERIFNVIETYGTPAIDALAGIIESQKVPVEALSHALRWVGRMRHPKSLHRRLWILRRSLLSSSPVVRDGAALGLAALGSPHAIPSLRAAIEREKLPALRADIERVLKQMELKS